MNKPIDLSKEDHQKAASLADGLLAFFDLRSQDLGASINNAMAPYNVDKSNEIC
ncbi:MAG: hypothetical protein H6908_01295 [Hyphomicrobiales bacterium]|nr:hypothetical protein [Hyphomicrobiales bacterium]